MEMLLSEIENIRVNCKRIFDVLAFKATDFTAEELLIRVEKNLKPLLGEVQE